MTPATVINVRDRSRSDLLSDPQFVYVGRGVGRAGWKASIFGNPFKPHPGTLNWRTPEQVVSHFERCLDFTVAGYPEAMHRDARIRKRFEDMAANLGQLRGKTLGCWCGYWRPGDFPIACHARVLAELVNTLSEAP